MARDDTILCEFTVCRLSPVIAGSAIVFATVKTGTTISFHADCLRSGNTRFSLYRIIEFFVPFLLPPPLHRLSGILHNFAYDFVYGGKARYIFN